MLLKVNARLSWILASWALILPFASAQCNPLKATCPPNRGLTRDYFVDFTKETALPEGWIIADYANVTYGSMGAEFTFKKRYDYAYIWTSFYILFGKAEVVMQAAPGAGIISSAVLLSDTQDEIDWEWSGSNYGAPNEGKVQTNYFGKGITGTYDRGTLERVDSPQTQFHTYTIDWTPTTLTWSIDGVVVRTHKAADADNADHQYPQSPSKFHLGLWNAGDPDQGPGTVAWAGGETDISKAPFTAYVKSARITNMMPCSEYEYTDMSGNLPSIQCREGTDTTTSMSASGSPSAPSQSSSGVIPSSPNVPSQSSSWMADTMSPSSSSSLSSLSPSSPSSSSSSSSSPMGSSDDGATSTMPSWSQSTQPMSSSSPSPGPGPMSSSATAVRPPFNSQPGVTSSSSSSSSPPSSWWMPPSADSTSTMESTDIESTMAPTMLTMPTVSTVPTATPAPPGATQSQGGGDWNADGDGDDHGDATHGAGHGDGTATHSTPHSSSWWPGKVNTKTVYVTATDC